MELFSSIPCILIAIAIIALNVAAAITGGKLSFWLTAAGIALHVAIAPLMLFEGLPLSELALVYLISLFAYLLPIYIIRKGEKP